MTLDEYDLRHLDGYHERFYYVSLEDRLLCGLKSRPELNGCVCRIKTPAPSNTRCAVEVSLRNGDKKTVSVAQASLFSPFITKNASPEIVDSRATSWNRFLDQPDGQSRLALLDAFSNVPRNELSFPYFIVQSMTHLFFCSLHINGLTPENMDEGMFGMSATQGSVGNMVFAIWGCLCETGNEHAKDAIRSNTCVTVLDVMMSIFRGDLPQSFRIWVERYYNACKNLGERDVRFGCVEGMLQRSLWNDIPWSLQLLQKLQVGRPPVRLSIGHRVRAFGLTQSKDLNDCIGTLVSYNGERWAVRFDRGGAPKLLRPSNLTRALVNLFDNDSGQLEASQVKEGVAMLLAHEHPTMHPNRIHWIQEACDRTTPIPMVKCCDPIFVPDGLHSYVHRTHACVGSGWCDFADFLCDLVDWPEEARLEKWQGRMKEWLITGMCPQRQQQHCDTIGQFLLLAQELGDSARDKGSLEAAHQHYTWGLKRASEICRTSSLETLDDLTGLKPGVMLWTSSLTLQKYVGSPEGFEDSIDTLVCNLAFAQWCCAVQSSHEVNASPFPDGAHVGAGKLLQACTMLLESRGVRVAHRALQQYADVICAQDKLLEYQTLLHTIRKLMWEEFVDPIVQSRASYEQVQSDYLQYESAQGKLRNKVQNDREQDLHDDIGLRDAARSKAAACLDKWLGEAYAVQDHVPEGLDDVCDSVALPISCSSDASDGDADRGSFENVAELVKTLLEEHRTGISRDEFLSAVTDAKDLQKVRINVCERQREQLTSCGQVDIALNRLTGRQSALKDATLEFRIVKRRQDDVEDGYVEVDENEAAVDLKLLVKSTRKKVQECEQAVASSIAELWRFQQSCSPELARHLVTCMNASLKSSIWEMCRGPERATVMAHWYSNRTITFYEKDDDVFEAEGVGRHRLHAVRYSGKQHILKEIWLSGKGRDRFVREIKLLARLAPHPNVMKLNGFFVDKMNGFLEFDRFPSDSLQWAKNDTSSNSGDVCRVLWEMAVAFEFVHGMSVVHGDVKPTNFIMSCEEGPRPLLCDFETAQEVGSDATTTFTAASMGFVAPEVLKGERPSFASDIFGLGRTFSVLLGVFANRICIPGDGICILTSGMTKETAGERPSAVTVARSPEFNAALLAERSKLQAQKEQMVHAMSQVELLEEQCRETQRAYAKMQEQAHAQLTAQRCAFDEERTQLAVEKNANTQLIEELQDQIKQEANDQGVLKCELALQQKRLEEYMKTCITPPAYWNDKSLTGAVQFYETRYMRDRLQHLLRTSACGRKQPGCAGVRQVQVVNVKRIENPMLWKAFAGNLARQETEFRKQGIVIPPLEPPETHHELLDASLNVMYAWHGCEWTMAEKISHEGFDERLATRGGLYGCGSYFAPQSCKALQYARHDGCSVYRKKCGGIYCTCSGRQRLLYCRVWLGEPFYATSAMKGVRRPPLIPGRDRRANSIVANPGIQTGEGKCQQHREFEIWNHQGAQAYPEFLVEVEMG